jgi:hypothetical protein
MSSVPPPDPAEPSTGETWGFLSDGSGHVGRPSRVRKLLGYTLRLLSMQRHLVNAEQTRRTDSVADGLETRHDDSSEDR